MLLMSYNAPESTALTRRQDPAPNGSSARVEHLCSRVTHKQHYSGVTG